MNDPVLLPAPQSYQATGVKVPFQRLDKPEIIIDSVAVGHPQGYRLTVAPEGVKIVAADEAGAFYAQKTLKQLKTCYAGQSEVEGAEIFDYPVVLERGIMLETLSGAVIQFDKLKEFVEMMADLKLNVLALYIEHTFAFRDHEEVWRDASPYTHEQILELDAFCRERFIELVPYLETFGHMHQWLKHDRYRPMAEVPEGWNHGFSVAPQPFTLCPSDPRSIEFLDGLYREIHEVFSSKKMLVGCDETDDLGKGRSKELCDRIGVGNVYVDFVNRIDERVRALGCETQIFGDVVVKHPQALQRLHREVVIAHWGYEADFPFDEHCQLFKELGFSFYLLPSTSAYHSFIGRTARGMGNIQNAVTNAVKHGARGVVNTQWNYRYNLTTIFDIPFFAYGAALCWQPEANFEEAKLTRGLDTHIFKDASGRFAAFLLELGRAFEPVAYKSNHYNPVYLTFYQCEQGKEHESFQSLDPAKLEAVLMRVRELEAELDSIHPTASRTAVWERGVRFGIKIFLCAGEALLALARDARAQKFHQLAPEVKADFRRRYLDLRREYEALWHVDNRPGGIALTLEWFDKMLGELE